MSKENLHFRNATKSQIKNYAHYLSPNEKMRYFTGLSNLYLFRRLVYGFIFPGILVIAAVVFLGFLLKFEIIYSLLAGYLAAFIFALVLVYFRAKGTQYILTDRRLIMQLGYFNVSLTSAAYDKITHIEVRQSFVERSTLKYGRVIIHTAGSKNREIVLNFVAHPLKFKNLMEKLVDEAQGHKQPMWKQSRNNKSKEFEIKKI